MCSNSMVNTSVEQLRKDFNLVMDEVREHSRRYNDLTGYGGDFHESGKTRLEIADCYVSEGKTPKEAWLRLKGMLDEDIATGDIE